MKILCVRLDNMGDILMTVPALLSLENSFIKPEITLLTSKSNKPLIPYLPIKTNTIYLESPWHKNRLSSASEVIGIVEKVRKENFDAAVIFTVFSQNPLASALICHAAGIPAIHAYCRENPYRLITHWIPDNEPFIKPTHEVDRQLRLVKKMGVKRLIRKSYLNNTDDSLAKLKRKLLKLNVSIRKPYLVVAPYASEKKRGLPDHLELVKALKRLMGEYGLAIYLTDKNQQSLNNIGPWKSLEPNFVDLTGKLELGELIALINNSRMVVSVNSAPMHLADVLHKSLLALYASTNHEHLPWQTENLGLIFYEIDNQSRSKNTVLKYYSNQYLKKAYHQLTSDRIYLACLKLLSR